MEPRVAARLLKLIADGNKYAAGVTSIGDKDVRIIIRETYQDPANYGKVSFPTAARVSDLAHNKGTLMREEMDLEDDLELDEEEEVIEDIGPCCTAVDEVTADFSADDDDDGVVNGAAVGLTTSTTVTGTTTTDPRRSRTRDRGALDR